MYINGTNGTRDWLGSQEGSDLADEYGVFMHEFFLNSRDVINSHGHDVHLTYDLCK